MSRQVVIGAGPVGTATARQLVERGDDVSVITRHGSAVNGATAVTADVFDVPALTAAFADAKTAFICINWPYQHWQRNWPNATDSLLSAAGTTGTNLVLASNLYGYAITASPFKETTPLQPPTPLGRVRAQVWQRLSEATKAGLVRATEVRASDYFGPGVGETAHLGSRFFRPIINGHVATVIGDPYALHVWSYVPDFARTLVAASDHDESWGKPWLVPNSNPFALHTIASQVNVQTGRRGSVRSVNAGALAFAALASPLIRNLRKLRYQFTHPFLTDASLTASTLGVEATPWSESLGSTVDYWQSELATL